MEDENNQYEVQGKKVFCCCLFVSLLVRGKRGVCEWKMLPVISANKRWCDAVIKLSATAAAPNSEPGGDSEWRQTGCPLPSPQPLQPPATVHPGETQDGKAQDMALDSCSAYQRNDFNELRFLHLPGHRKVLNLLTWVIWFSLTITNLLMLQLFGLCYKTPIYPGSSLTSSEQTLRAIWEAASWAWGPQKSGQIKHNSQLLHCASFYSWQVIARISFSQGLTCPSMQRGSVTVNSHLPPSPGEESSYWWGPERNGTCRALPLPSPLLSRATVPRKCGFWSVPPCCVTVTVPLHGDTYEGPALLRLVGKSGNSAVQFDKAHVPPDICHILQNQHYCKLR